MSATALAKSLARGELTSEALVESCFARIKDHNDDSIFISLTKEAAFKAARASDARRKAGKLLSVFDGIPVAWKDLFDVPGTATTAASAVYENATPPVEPAVIFDNCTKAGMICIGKTNLSEFAYSGLGLNPHFGTPVNPNSKDDPLAPGGSSAGSAVAVAASIVPLAVGTDTAGSVRVPAAFCGIVGFKSSQKHYDKAGIFPLSESLDSVGTFAHTIEDLITFDAILRGDPTPAPQAILSDAKPNLIIPTTLVMEGLNPEVAAAFEGAVKQLIAAGYSVVEREFPIFAEVTDLFSKHGTLTVAEAAALHKDLLASADAAKMDQRVRERMLSASQFTAQDYIQLQWERARLQAAVVEKLGDDILLFPTVSITAPSIAKLEADNDLFVATNLMALRNTMLGNYLGMPGVSLPIGVTPSNTTIGALFSMANTKDLDLLTYIAALEPVLLV
nr:amidase family protein [Yoonia sp. I 8.24]